MINMDIRSLVIIMILTIMLLLPIYVSTQTPQYLSYPLIINDKLDLGGWMDLQLVNITENNDDLIIMLRYNGTMPIPENSPEEYRITGHIFIDVDNDPGTGCTSYYGKGTEVRIDFEVNAAWFWRNMRNGEINWFNIYKYDPISNNWEFYANPQELQYNIVNYNNNYVIVRIPYELLSNITGINDISIIRVYISDCYSSYGDWIVPFTGDGMSSFTWIPINITTVPYGQIIVDGNPNDWYNVLSSIADLSDDTYNADYQELNVTEVYFAKDNETLYIRFDLRGPIDYNRFFITGDSTYSYGMHMNFEFDKDLDDTMDTSVYLERDHALVNGTWIWQSNDYQVVVFNTLSTEYAISLKYIPYLTTISQINVRRIAIWVDVRDDPFISFEDGVGPKEYIIWIRGSGGYFISPTYTLNQYMPPGENTVIVEGAVSNAVIDFNALTGEQVVIQVYGSSPIGFIPPGAIVVSDFFNIKFSDPDNIKWPIIINITYNESFIKQYPYTTEDYLRVYYYDGNSQQWIQCSNFTIDSANNVITIYLTKDEYLAFDQVLFIGMPRGLKLVGGSIDVQGTLRYTQLCSLIILLAIVLAIGMFVLIRKKL